MLPEQACTFFSPLQGLLSASLTDIMSSIFMDYMPAPPGTTHYDTLRPYFLVQPAPLCGPRTSLKDVLDMLQERQAVATSLRDLRSIVAEKVASPPPQRGALCVLCCIM